MPNLDRLINNKGFTLIEVLVASMIIAFVAAGIWGVYWSVVNTYYVEQKGVHLETEGERILDLIANGGYFNGKRIYGLNSSVPYTSGSTPYPRVGKISPGVFTDIDCIIDEEEFNGTYAWNCSSYSKDDYRIQFCLDSTESYRRFAEFSVVYYPYDPTPGSSVPDDIETKFKTQLWFKYTTSGVTITGFPNEYHYRVLISQNLLPRRSGSDPDVYGGYDETWFKAQLLPKDSSSDYYSGIKVSLYLADMTQPILYNYRLDRKPDPPISDPDQRRSFMGGIPYPKYFSTTVYFPNRE